jgi:hypothetical protein
MQNVQCQHLSSWCPYLPTNHPNFVGGFDGMTNRLFRRNWSSPRRASFFRAISSSELLNSPLLQTGMYQRIDPGFPIRMRDTSRINPILGEIENCEALLKRGPDYLVTVHYQPAPHQASHTQADMVCRKRALETQSRTEKPLLAHHGATHG